MELADQQNSEASGVVAGVEIPVTPEAGVSTPASNSSPASQEKPSLRQTLEKSIETVRTEEAKRARDVTNGRFTKTEAEAAPEIPKPATEAKPAESNPDAPPSAWKGIWESMTPEARAIAVKREGEVAKGFDEYRTKAKTYEAIEQVLAPARARFQQQGIQNDAQALHNILSWEQGLHDPATRVKAYRDLGQQLGIDLSTLVPSSSQAPSQAQDIPEPLRPVIDQFGNIVQQVQSVEARIQSWEQRQTSEQIAAFAKDKPHFEKVSVLMGQLMQAGSAKDLDSAYQQAIKIHPEVGPQIEAERVTKEAAEREKAQAEKAAAARRAAVSPSGRSPHGGAADASQQRNGKQSVRDAILSSVTALREGQRA